MTTFQVGRVYYCRSIGDHDSIWRYLVVKRTAKTVTLEDYGTRETFRRGIRIYNGVECCSPHGRYSMSPTLSADKTGEPTR